MYAKYIKRPLDFILALIAFIVLLPLLIVLTILGAIMMSGNPFFVQPRPGKNERIFKLIKFRTMTNKKDKSGNLLPDEERLTRYGKFLRSTSLDELPELINIIKGDMSIVGPRPLLVEYLPLYNEHQCHRHDVRPGLTGWAQINGRNAIDWEERLCYDLIYVRNITFIFDIKIVLITIRKVLSREGISSGSSSTMEPFKGNRTESVIQYEEPKKESVIL